MVDTRVMEAADVTVIVDGVTIMNATSADVNRSKQIARTDVIGTKAQRISEGSVEYSGTLTELRHNDFGLRMLRSKLASNLKFQKNADVAAVDTDIGISTVQHTLTTGNLTASQDFVALGDRLDYISLLMERDSEYQGDITLVVKDGVTTLGTFTLPNEQISTTKFYAVLQLDLAERLALTEGSVYTLEVTHDNGTGDVRLYGADLQDYVLLGTGDGIETTFTTLHTTVVSSTLFVRKDDAYQGQLEGYTFSDGTGVGGEDEIVFGTAPANGVEVYAKYEYDDSDLFAWRLGFASATNPQYTLRFEHYDDDDKLIDVYEIRDVRFSSNGIVVNPATFVERTMNWEGRLEVTEP